MSTVLNQMIQAQVAFQSELLMKPGVVGVAVGYKNYQGDNTEQLALVALVEEKKPLEALSADEVIPRDINGARTDVVEVGVLRALQLGPRDRYRPSIPAGVSMGHFKITAGTFGAVVKDKTTGEPLILSNNHVLANSNDALVGDDILQPGPTDGGIRPTDVVAKLERFIRLRYVGDPEPTPPPPPDNGGDNGDDPPPPAPPPPSGCDVVDVVVSFGNILARLNGSEKRLTSTTVAASSTSTATATQTATVSAQDTHINQIDAAVAKPLSNITLDENIRHIGPISGVAAPSLGMSVRKAGRTTDFTTGTITLVNATVNVNYHTVAGPRVARFGGQIITTPMSQGGDSGSLVVQQGANNAVGLLFAGSAQATIFSPIQIVLDELNVTF